MASISKKISQFFSRAYSRAARYAGQRRTGEGEKTKKERKGRRKKRSSFEERRRGKSPVSSPKDSSPEGKGKKDSSSSNKKSGPGGGGDGNNNNPAKHPARHSISSEPRGRNVQNEEPPRFSYSGPFERPSEWGSLTDERKWGSCRRDQRRAKRKHRKWASLIPEEWLNEAEASYVPEEGENEDSYVPEEGESEASYVPEEGENEASYVPEEGESEGSEEGRE